MTDATSLRMEDSTNPSTPSMALGVDGFTYADLYDPARLAELYDVFDAWFSRESASLHARFAAYRACKGQGMGPLERSEALLAAAPYVGAFIGRLFGVEEELRAFREKVRSEDPLWRFRKDFAKRRVLRSDAGKAWTLGAAAAETVARAALQAVTAAPLGGTTDEELTIASAVLPLIEVDLVARRAAKSGGAEWSDEFRAHARAVKRA